MKRTLLVFLAVFMTFSGTGQTTYRPTRMNVTDRSVKIMQRRNFLPEKTPAQRTDFVRILPGVQSRLKSNGTFIKQLDSVYFDSYKHISGQLEPDSKNEFIYDDNNNLTRETAYNWDMFEEQWVPAWLEELTFNSSGDLLLHIYSEWDPVEGDWSPDYQDEYFYYADGSLEIIIESYRNYDNNQWEYDWKDEFFYDDGGKITENYSYTYEPVSEQWDKYYKTEYEYDQDGNMILITLYEWAPGIDDWFPDTRYEQIFDSEGNTTEGYSYVWNDDIDDWEAYSKTGYTVGQDGLINQLIFFEPADEPGEWLEVSKVEYIYDGNLNLIEEVTYYMDDEAVWLPVNKYEYTLDDSYTSDQVLSPYYFYHFITSVNMLTEINHYNYINEWFKTYRTRLFYSDYETGEEPGEYTLIINIAGNGIVEVDGTVYSAAINFEEGTVVTLYAIADEGWNFDGWTGDLISDNETETITMNSNRSITATFTESPPQQHTLTLTIEGSGNVEVNGTTYTSVITEDAGNELTLEAIPDDGNEFVEWTGDIESTVTGINVTMDEDKNITAVFSVISSVQLFTVGDPEVFPNPFLDHITIQNTGNFRLVTITNMAGRVIGEIELKGYQTRIVSLPDLEEGIYILIFLNDKGGKTVKKIIKN